MTTTPPTRSLAALPDRRLLKIVLHTDTFTRSTRFGQTSSGRVGGLTAERRCPGLVSLPEAVSTSGELDLSLTLGLRVDPTLALVSRLRRSTAEPSRRAPCAAPSVKLACAGVPAMQRCMLCHLRRRSYDRSSGERGDCQRSDAKHHHGGGEAVGDRAGPADGEGSHEVAVTPDADHREQQRHQ